MPLVTAPGAGLTTPVPPLKVGVKVTLPPAVRAVLDARKLWMRAGAGTVTVALAVWVAPEASVTVSV